MIRRCTAFSLVEVVLSMVILSLLLSISISYYQDASERVRENTAVNQLKEYGDAVERWTLENNQTYPYDNLRPLIGTYIDREVADPWGQPYTVKAGQGVMMSSGPNRTPEDGSGDDISYTYGVLFQATPLSPTRLEAKMSGSGSVTIAWEPPMANVDSSPLATGTGTWTTEIIRSAGPAVLATQVSGPVVATVPWGTRTFSDNIGSATGTSVYYVVRIRQEVPGQGTVYSSYSNQAGIFIAKSLPPEIVRFRPSAFRLPVGQPFHIDVEVSDPSAGLSDVRITFDNQTYSRGPIQNKSYYAERFVPTLPSSPKTISGIRVDVTGGSASDQTTSKLLDLPVEFVNSAPAITSLRPGVTNFTVSPATTAAINFIVEARDRDRNLASLTVRDDSDHEQRFDYQGGVDFAVERFSWDYDLSTTSAFNVIASAVDTLGQTAPSRIAVVAISADVTPPATPKINLVASNTSISTDCAIVQWYVLETDRIKGHWESYDPETEPVAYEAILTTGPFTGASGELDRALTWDGSRRGFTSRITTTEFDLRYQSGGGALAEPLKEDVDYWLGVRAINNAGLVNEKIVYPENPICRFVQYPFRVDHSPPQVTALSVDTPFGPQHPWISQGPLTLRWNSDDVSENGNPGSGAYLYEYKVYETTRPTDPLGKLFASGKTKGREVRLPVNFGSASHRSRYTVRLRVRDVSGNWSVSTSQVVVNVDLTGPGVTTAPRIITPEGVITNSSAADVTWAASTPPDIFSRSSTFSDFESGIESFQWGLSTSSSTFNPDLFPGGGLFQFEGPSILFSRANRIGLFQDGDVVFLMVKARNYAGLESPISLSNPTFVDTDLEPTLRVSPRLGFAPLTVNFSADVRGGGPCYRYQLQPRSNPDPTAPENFFEGPLKSASMTAVVRTYDRSDLGGRTARLIVESMAELTSGQCDVTPLQQRQVDAGIVLRPHPYALVLGNESSDGTVRLRVLDGDDSLATLTELTLPTAPGTATAINVRADPLPAKNYAIAATHETNDAHFYRIDLGGGFSVTQNVSITDFFASHFDIAEEGTILMATGNVSSGAPRIVRISLSNGVMGTPELITSNVTGTGVPPQVALFRTGGQGYGARGSTQLEKINNFSGAASVTEITLPLAARRVDYAQDNRTVVIAGASENLVAFLDPSTDSVRTSPLATNLSVSFDVRDVKISNDSQQAFLVKANELVNFNLNNLARREGNSFGNTFPGAGFVAGSLAFENSYVAVADQFPPTVRILHSRSDGFSPLSTSAVFTFGEQVVSRSLATLVPADVVLMDRPEFGSPVVVSAAPNPVVGGQLLEIRGHNLYPVGSLTVLFDDQPITPVIPAGFGIIQVVAPAAPGQYEVRVENTAYPNVDRRVSQSVISLEVQ